MKKKRQTGGTMATCKERIRRKARLSNGKKVLKKKEGKSFEVA